MNRNLVVLSLFLAIPAALLFWGGRGPPQESAATEHQQVADRLAVEASSGAGTTFLSKSWTQYDAEIEEDLESASERESESTELDHRDAHELERALSGLDGVPFVNVEQP